MEKKNVVFLTVLSIATLLTAVIGTTFAYFTASIDNTGVTATGTVTAAVLPGLTVSSGAIQGPTTIYPGWGGYQVVTAVGSGSTATETGYYTLKFTSVTNNIGNALVADVYTAEGSGVTVTSANYNATTCVPASDASGHYTMTGCTFTPGSTFTSVATGLAVADNTTLDDNTFTKNTNRTYVIVYRFVNDSSNEQNTAQGQTFTASVAAESRANS